VEAALEPHLLVGDGRAAADALPELRQRIALVVTSPPYHNAISYQSHIGDPGANYRRRDSISYADLYLPLLDQVWAACHVLLAAGGHLAINVGSVLVRGHHHPLPQDILQRLMEAPHEWEFIRSIIWNKVTGGVKRAGSAIRYGLPGYWHPNIMSEHVIVVRKPGPDRRRSDVPEQWWDSVWDLAPVPPGRVPHPAPFPEDLPHRLIRMLTAPGDYVLDPFLGAGATAKAALDLDRVPVGFDIETQYVDYARKRLERPSSVRPQQLRVEVVAESDFVPGRSRGATRHGAGLRQRRS
jgi:DNA modification methylase